MKKVISDKAIITFSTPDSINGCIYVNKVFADGSMENIGKIETYYQEEEGCVLYTAFDLHSQQIFPSTTDFTEIETHFISHAKAQSEKSFMEDMLREAEKSNKRKESLKHIRNLKFRDFGFIKSY